MKATSHREKVTQEIERRTNKALELIRPALIATIQKDTPFVTGRLVRSISGEIDSSGHKLTVGSPVEYAGYVEGGTEKMAPRAYLRKGFIKSISFIKKIFRIV